MANHLDLEEQEQLDQLKHFWNQYGNAITWVLIVLLGVFAAWNGFSYWQRSKAAQAAVLFDEVDRAIQSADAGLMDRVLGDMKAKFPDTLIAQQAALLIASQHVRAGRIDLGKAALGWVSEHPVDAGYQSIAKLRLAGLMTDAKQYDEALTQLRGGFPPEFEALASDRRGDIYALKGEKSLAITEYEKAFRLFAPLSEYRRLVEVKLNAQGVDTLKLDLPKIIATK